MFDDVGVLDFVMAVLAFVLVVGGIRTIGQIMANREAERFKSDPCFKQKPKGDKK